MVGSSGIAAMRCDVVTASAASRPAVTRGPAEVTLSNVISMSPASRSAVFVSMARSNTSTAGLMPRFRMVIASLRTKSG